MSQRHNIRIETKSHALLTKIFLDGQELRGVMSIRVEIDGNSSNTLFSLTLIPSELTIDGEDVPLTMTTPIRPLRREAPQLTQENETE